MAKPPLLQALDITFKRGTHTILDQVTITIKQGQILTVIGPNGAGKSTLLRILLGLQHGFHGHVQPMPHLKIGYMPQKLFVDSTLPLRVIDFLELWRGGTRARIQETLDVVRALSLIHKPLQGLSGGEMQRILLARALLQKPDLLVLDEPVQGVDILGQQEFYDLIRHLRDALGCGILLVSHDLHMVMAASDQVVCLNGHVCCEGHPEDVKANPQYHALFGPLVPYTHHHDHCHNTPEGEVCTHDHH